MVSRVGKRLSAHLMIDHFGMMASAPPRGMHLIKARTTPAAVLDLNDLVSDPNKTASTRPGVLSAHGRTLGDGRRDQGEE